MAHRPLRTALAVLFVLLLVALATPNLASNPDTEWTVLVDDPSHDVQGEDGDTEPRADILRALAREEGDRLWLRLETRAPGSAPAPTSSTASLPLTLPATSAAPASATPTPLGDDGFLSTLTFTIQRNAMPESSTFDLAFDGANGGPRLLRDDGRDLQNALVVDEADRPWNYEIGITRWALFDDATYAPGDVVTRVSVGIQTRENPARTDRAPDVGYAGQLVHTLGPRGQVMPAWDETEADGRGAAPDIASDGAGVLHISYIVYDGAPGTPTGLYHGTIEDGSWSSERIADARVPSEGRRETDKTATAIAADEDDLVHIAFHPEAGLGAVGAIRYARGGQGGAWAIEDPAAVEGGAPLAVENGYRAVPDIVAGGGRVVLAFQQAADQGVAVVERGPAGTWTLLTSIPNARFARLDLDGEEKVHVAWFRPGQDGYPDRGVDGALYYASEPEGWAEREISPGPLTDITRFWEGAEGDGSFDFKLAPDGTPTFVYDDGGHPRYATLHDGHVESQDAPLVPVHGNPQYRIRMAFDRPGNLHLVSGYGGSDHYAFRTPDGYWTRQDNYRLDMFGLAVTPDGRAATSYANGGGIGVNTQTGVVQPAERPDDGPYTPVFLPGPGGAVALMVVGGVGLLGARWGVPALADGRPRLLWRGLAVVGAGFSRLHRDQLLDHDTRDVLVAAAREAPGRSAADLRRDLELPRSTFFYHVRRLEREGLLRLARQGTQLFVFGAAGAGATLASPATVESQLLALVAEAPGLAAPDYALRLQRHPRTVHQHLLRLARQGRIHAMRESARDVRWVPAPPAAA